MIPNFVYGIFTKSLVVLAIAALSVNYLPDKLFGELPFDPKPSKQFDYNSILVEWNSKLSDGQPEYIQLNQIVGPESLAIHPSSGLFYTGLADGRLVELNPNKNYQLRQVLRFNDKSPLCRDDNDVNIDVCGRFLQLRFQNDTLYAVESAKGLYKIDIKAKSKTFVGPKALIQPAAFYNSFAFDPVEPNIVYMTISSLKWSLEHILWLSLEPDNSGQLIALDLNTGKRVVLLSGLGMANGLDVDAKRDQLVFTETFASRISSVSLKELRSVFKAAKDGAKLVKVNVEPVLPLVPGYPDNVVVFGDKLYIALPSVKTHGTDLIDHLHSLPLIRKALVRMIYGAGKLLEQVHDNIFQHPTLELIYRELKSGRCLYRSNIVKKSGIIEYNLATKERKFYGSDLYGFISEAMPDGKGNLYIMSFRSPFIVKVKNLIN